MNNAEIGKRIRSKRKEIKMNQKALADILGISQPEMSNIEKGKRQLSDARIQQVSQALSCDSQWLASGVESAAPAVSVVA